MKNVASALTALALVFGIQSATAGDKSPAQNLTDAMEKMVGTYQPVSWVLLAGKNQQILPTGSTGNIELKKHQDGHMTALRPGEKKPIKMDFMPSANGESMTYTINLPNSPQNSWKVVGTPVPSDGGKIAFVYKSEDRQYFNANSPEASNGMRIGNEEVQVKRLAGLSSRVGLDLSPYKDGGLSLAPPSILFDPVSDMIIYVNGLVDSQTEKVIFTLYSVYTKIVPKTE